MKQFRWALICLGVIVFVLWVVPVLWAGSWTHKVAFPNTDGDSAFVYITLDGDEDDRDTITNFSTDTVSFALDSANAYACNVTVFYGSDPYGYYSYIIPAMTSNAVVGSITYVDSVGKLLEGGGVAGADKDLVVTVLDTPSTTLSGAYITLYDDGGTPVYVNYPTYSDGTCTLRVVDGSYTAYARKYGYAFRPSSVTVNSDPENDTLYGNGYPVISPPADSQCYVYGYLSDVMDSSVIKVPVKFYATSNTYNSCNNKSVDTRPIVVRTDTLGMFGVYLTWSSCINDIEYEASLENKGSEPRTVQFTVPDQDTLFITFGD